MLKWHFLKIQNFDPYFFDPLNYTYFESPCCTIPIPVLNFVKFRRRVSELEGIRLKHKIVPAGHNFDPSG